MKRILLSGLALLLGATTLICIARSNPAHAGKADLLTFRFIRVDPGQDLAILRPMIAPDIGVQLDSGSRKLEKHTVLQCRASNRERDALVEGQPGKITEMLLDCGDYKFVVKGLDFSPDRK
jgi:hypothetical protein